MPRPTCSLVGAAVSITRSRLTAIKAGAATQGKIRSFPDGGVHGGVSLRREHRQLVYQCDVSKSNDHRKIPNGGGSLLEIRIE